MTLLLFRGGGIGSVERRREDARDPVVGEV